MTGVLEGFATIGIVIAVGAMLAHLDIIDVAGARVLQRMAFFVASPALMIGLIGRTDVSHVLSRQLVATVAGVAVPVLVYVLAARFAFGRNLGETVIGSLCSAYVNAGNLGLPVAAYVLGDATFVVPTLLLQLCVLTPIAVALLDHDARDGGQTGRLSWLRPLLNPLTIGMLIGLTLSLTGARLPAVVANPLELIGAMAVPSMLVAYGVSLRLGGGFGSGSDRRELVLVSALKLLVQPGVATGVGFLLGLRDEALLACAVVSLLPTAQNVFTYASRYRRSELLTRDNILVTTILAVPLTVTAALVLG